MTDPSGTRERAGRSARARSVAARIGLASVAVLATLGFVELVLTALFEPVLDPPWQVRELFQLDDELIYSMRPSYARVAPGDEFVEHATTNRHGLRDDEIGPRDRFEKRIVILGDSMVFGHGVDDPETFPSQLEAIYGAEGRAVDVINAGVKGYGTDGAYKLFVTRLEPLALEADLVVFSVYHNDLHDNVSQPLYTIEKGALVPLDATRNWIHLLASIDRKAPEFVKDRILYGLILSRFVGRDVYSVLPNLEGDALLHWAAQKALLEIVDLRRRGRAQGFELLVLGVPYRDGPPDFYAWLDAGRKLGIQVFDASADPVWSTDRERLFFGRDFHMTPAGNRTLAEMVHAALAQRAF